jgi:hypothetical protein
MTFPICEPKAWSKRFRTRIVIDWSARAIRSAWYFSNVRTVYAPVTAGLLAPFRGDCALAKEKRRTVDCLYQHICDGLGALL